ncbi:hypothetical protein V1478_008190 [Vespula squamosa]|uniref:Uncharacterized protein n=1 Tax=Vespula squamosa TaxID=30214 RepID=A0ABD2AY35_VESSQ
MTLSNLSLGLGIAIKLDDKDNDEGGCDRDCEGNEVLDFVVQYKYEGTTSTTKNIRECTLEECITTFRFVNSGPAMKSTLVQDFRLRTSGLHHHAPTYRIEGIRYDTGNGSYNLKNKHTNSSIWQHTTGSVIETEIRRSVDNDTLDGYSKTTV